MKQAYDYIRNYKDVHLSYEPPCLEMNVLAMYERNLKQKWDEFAIKVTYLEETYQEIDNIKDFGFETFWSSVGGFVGIFWVAHCYNFWT